MNRVTDIHIHVQPWGDLHAAVRETMWRRRPEPEGFFPALMQDPANLLAEMDRRGIWRAGVINYPSPDVMGFSHGVNDFVLSYAKADRERILAFGGLLPDDHADPASEVARLAAAGLRGLKFQPPHQLFAANAYVHGMRKLADVYAAAQRAGLPVMIHTGTSVFPGARNRFGHPMDLDDVCVDYPKLPVIMAHGGRPLWMDEAFFLLRRHQNLWLDVSSIPPSKLLEFFPRLEAVSDRTLWGTDWPAPGVPDMRTNLDAFLALPLPPAAKQAITIENALRLFPNAGH